MTEDQLAEAWAKLARNEGHASRLPTIGRAYEESGAAIQARKMRAEGMSLRQIAAELDLSRSRISQLLGGGRG